MISHTVYIYLEAEAENCRLMSADCQLWGLHTEVMFQSGCSNTGLKIGPEPTADLQLTAETHNNTHKEARSVCVWFVTGSDPEEGEPEFNTLERTDTTL